MFRACNKIKTKRNNWRYRTYQAGKHQNILSKRKLQTFGNIINGHDQQMEMKKKNKKYFRRTKKNLEKQVKPT